MELVRKCWVKPIQVRILYRHLAYSGKSRIFTYLPRQTWPASVNTVQVLFQIGYIYEAPCGM